jgi:hypothetical protein
MKIKWAILKSPKFIIGAIVLFFVVLFLMNRSGSSSTTSSTTVSGTDPNVLAAQTQLAIAQLGANVQTAGINAQEAASADTNQTQIALATIAAAVSNSQTAAQEAIAQQTVAAQVHGLDLQYQTAVANNNAQIAAMQTQANYGIAMSAISANLQAQLSADQLKAFTTSTLANQIPTVSHKRGEQYAALSQLIQQNSGNPANTNVTINIPNLATYTPAGQLS